MATIILGEHPDGLTVRLVHGDGATLAATLTDATGSETDWPAAPKLEFAGADHTVKATHVATINGSAATWTLTRAQVDTIWTGTLGRYGTPNTYVRAVLPDSDDGSVEYAGKVAWSDGWTAGSNTQAVTFTMPGGPAGPTGPKGDKGDPGDSAAAGVSVDHGSVGATLTITQPGSHELDLSTNLAVTISTTGDVSLRVHGTGTVTVAGETFDIDGVGVILVVTWPRGQDAYMVGAGSSTPPDEGPVDPGPTTGWNVIASDTFTGTSGPITSRALDVNSGTGGWRPGPSYASPAPGSLVNLSLASNRLTSTANHNTITNLSVEIGSSARNGLRAGVNYEFHSQTDTNTPVLWINFGPLKTAILPSGAIAAANGGADGDVTLTGTTTGHPTSGRFEAEVQGTALTLRVNGVTAATGTVSANRNAETFVGLDLLAFGASFVDNFTVEALT